MMPKLTALARPRCSLGDLLERHAEDLGGDELVNVAVLGERGLQGLVAAEVGEHAELDLRVVGGEQHVVGVAGHEGRADLPAELGADGDVLQVRVARREPAGDRRRSG